MKFAYLLPTTLTDYPGMIAALAYTAACNFRCPFCHNSELVLPKQSKRLNLLPEKEVLYFLRERQGFLDGLVITGGEPTLHHDLPEFIARVKRLGLLVKLDTNGSRPEMLDDLLRAHLIDYVAMDVKCSPARYDELTGVHVDMEAIERSIALIIARAPDYEFRTTVAPTMSEADIKGLVPLLSGAKRYFLQQFVVPSDKELVDPGWRDRAALSERELLAVWAKIEHAFPEGGVR
ncbi:anaerobic ribonucleoside-triphosphate reductase activating protein [Candidatus Bipolaricaulota bacterium]|nr:anaerobic ribonucleoside-triphosphate reductase activating protein [Candidatus Bipolaricaulota bacterium]